MADNSGESKVDVVHAVCIAFMVHTILVVGLRLYSRIAVVRAVGVDDGALRPDISTPQLHGADMFLQF
jgi:hypothetical protein